MPNDTTYLTESVDESLLKAEDRISVQLVEYDKVLYETEVPVGLINPYTTRAENFLPNSARAMTLSVFFETASKLIADAQGRAGADSSKTIKLTEEYPPEPFETYGDEVIAYRVLKREPARMNAKGTARPHRKSTFTDEVTAPEYPNKVIIIEARPIDHLIEFTCWGKSNKLANARALWLEKLFITHAWAFEVQGADRFFWKDRGPDTYMTSGGQRLFYRPINFFVRFREFEIKAHPQIKQLIFEASATNNVLT